MKKEKYEKYSDKKFVTVKRGKINTTFYNNW